MDDCLSDEYHPVVSVYFSVFKTEGASMEYTLEHDQRVVGLQTFDSDRFDVVIFHAPGESKDYVKRVIGLPSDVNEYREDV